MFSRGVDEPLQLAFHFLDGGVYFHQIILHLLRAVRVLGFLLFTLCALRPTYIRFSAVSECHIIIYRRSTSPGDLPRRKSIPRRFGFRLRVLIGARAFELHPILSLRGILAARNHF